MPPLLTLNVGSSSLKAGLYDGDALLARRSVATGGLDLLAILSEELPKLGASLPAGVGHRIVHGGQVLYRPTLVTDEVLAQLDAVVPFAPLHLPKELETIRAVRQLWPTVPQVVCFDTTFHITMPTVEKQFGLPRALYNEGVRRYGFHGLSYEWIASQLPDHSARAAAGRTVVCHLGSGASLCGMRAGQSVTTTMGFTPLDGLLMATRCGRVDPGIILYLLQQRGMSPGQVRHLLEHESGLLGVSGIASDMRQLLDDKSPAAAEAVELFCHTVAREVGAAAVSLGGLDAVVFTGGIGENSPAVRQRVCEQLRWLGITFDDAANRQNSPVLHSPATAIQVFCLPTDEERVIARHTAGLLAG